MCDLLLYEYRRREEEFFPLQSWMDVVDLQLLHGKLVFSRRFFLLVEVTGIQWVDLHLDELLLLVSIL